MHACSHSGFINSKNASIHQTLVKKYNARYISPCTYKHTCDKYYVTVAFASVKDMAAFTEDFSRLTTNITEKVRKLPLRRRVVKFLTCFFK